MNKFLENKHPYLTNFFKTAIEQNRLFHSLIFYGSNQYIQYAMALELARQLNCLKDGNNDCDCQNCRWIKQNRHPAIMTISKIDNKSDTSKTVISEEQINSILDTLVNTSDYHRVFIFCDAEMKKLSQTETEEYLEFKNAQFSCPQEDEEKVWYPSGINSTCFSAVASNSMLKSIEEPNSKITFIFLTNNKDDLLQTIVSRSQAFYIPDTKKTVYNINFFQKYFNNYPQFDKNTVLEFSQCLLDYQTENNFEPKYIIDCLQFYLTELLKSNHQNFALTKIILKDIEKTEISKKMLNAYVKEATVYENLAFYFCKR